MVNSEFTNKHDNFICTPKNSIKPKFIQPNNALISLCIWHKKSTQEKLSMLAPEAPGAALSSHKQ